jgi:hypothetical protein
MPQIRRGTNDNNQTDGTDEYGDVYDFDNDMPALLNKIDIGAYIGKNGKLTDKAMTQIIGGFKWTNMANKMGEFTLEFDTPLTEYIVGQLLFQSHMITPFLDMGNTVISDFAELLNYETLPFYSAIQEYFIENMKYINPQNEVRRGRYRKLISIRNPFSSRQIKVDKATFKKIYKNIKIKQITYKKLSNHIQTDYDIIDNCAIDFLKTLKISVDDIENILNRKVSNDLNYEDISNVLHHNNIGCKFLTVFDNELMNNGLQIKYVFKLHNEHLYIINDEPIKYNGSIVINKIDSIEKYKKKILVVESSELFKELKTYINKDYSMIGYSDKEILFKNNKICLNEMYTDDKLMLQSNKSKCKTAYNFVNSKLNFLGYISKNNNAMFKNCNKIRLFKTDKVNDVQYDMNKAYKSILLNKNIVYPIPNINDNWRVYSGRLCVHGFYYCELKTYDKILGKYDDIYFYNEVVELQKYDRIKKIKYEFVTISKIKLCDEHITFINDLSNDLSRRFVGWLQKSLSTITKKYDDVSENEGLGMQNYYGLECTYYKNKKMSVIQKCYTRKQTGLLINILIKGLTNIKLFDFNNEFMRLNPTAVLNSIKTDSLGYLCDDIVTPNIYISDKIGDFKNETPSVKCLKNYEYNYIPTVPTIQKLEYNTLCENSLNEYLNNNYNLLIDGIFGCGKTSVIIPQIEKILNESNKKCIKAAITNTASQLINGCTLFSLFTKKSDHEIISYFNDYDYLIIDERTQIDQKTYKYLEFIKENTKIKFILIGDDNQIKNRFVNYSYKDSKFILSLVDGNVIKLSNETKRCDEGLKKHLDYLRSNIGVGEAKKYILTNFNVVSESKTNMNLTLYGTTRDKIISTGKRCDTIMNNQGLTIDEPYTLHDLNYIKRVDIIVTALSRSTKSEYINICKN